MKFLSICLFLKFDACSWPRFDCFPDLPLEMVKVLNFSYVYKYPFELVTRAYFKKYTSGYEKNVEKIWIVEEKKGLESNIDYIKRKGKCANIIPWSLQMFFSEPAIYFEEEIWFNRKDKNMTMHCRNVSFTHLATLEERSVYKVSDEDNTCTCNHKHSQDGYYSSVIPQKKTSKKQTSFNAQQFYLSASNCCLQNLKSFLSDPVDPVADNKTKFEQEGIITVSGIGWLNSFAETCAATVFSSGAYKGFGIMESLLKKLKDEAS